MVSTLVQALDFCSVGTVGIAAGPVAGAYVGVSELASKLGQNLIHRATRLGNDNAVVAKVVCVAAGIVFCVTGGVVFLFTCMTHPWTFTVSVSTNCLIYLFKIKERISGLATKKFTNPGVDDVQHTHFVENLRNKEKNPQKLSPLQKEMQQMHFAEDTHTKEMILQEFSRLKNRIEEGSAFLRDLLLDSRHYQLRKSQNIPNPPYTFNDEQRKKEILRLFDSTSIKVFNDDGTKKSRVHVRSEIVKQLDCVWFYNNSNNKKIFDWLIYFFTKNPDQIDDFIKELGAAAFHCSARIATLLSDFYICYVKPDQLETASTLQITTRLYMFLDRLRKGILDNAATFKADLHLAATHAWVRKNIGPTFGVWNVLEDTRWDDYSYVQRGKNDDIVRTRFISCYTPSIILEILQKELHRGASSEFSFMRLQEWFDARHIKAEEFTEEITDEKGNVNYPVKKEALLYFLMATHVVRPDAQSGKIYK